MKLFNLIFLVVLYSLNSYGQNRVGSLTKTKTTWDNDITFDMPGGIVSLESVEVNNGKHDIVFQSNEVYLDNVVINCKTLRFTAAVKYIKTSKTVTMVCDNLEFENSGSALVFEKIVHKPDSKLIIKYKRVYSNNRKLQFDIQNTDSIVYSSN